MTRFAAPLKVLIPFADTTVARVDASGSAVFTGGMRVDGPIRVSGAPSFAGEMLVSASARFNGAVKMGDAATLGNAVLLTLFLACEGRCAAS